jgi:uncharacterized membrane protein
MASPEQERMDALSEAILRLRAQQEQIERRLGRIEARLGLQAVREPAAPRAMESAAGAPPAPVVESAAAPEAPPAPMPEAPSREPAFETRMGLTWLNRIGVVTLVLGVAFFFKYAVDNQWIGETARVLLGVAAGLAALGLGERFWRRDQKTFAQGVSGAGVAILYVSFYAAFVFYSLVPQPLAFALMVLNTAAAGALALRYEAPALATLGLLGGYMTPILLSTGEDRPWALLSYVLLLNLGALAVAQKKQWRVLEWLAFAATVVLYSSWTIGFRKSQHLPALMFLLIYYGLFATRKNRVLVAVAQFIAMLELAVWTCPTEPLRFLPLAALLAAAGLAAADRRGWRETPAIAFCAFWLIYSPAQPELSRHASPELFVVLLTIVFGIFAAWLPWRVARRGAASSLDMLVSVLNAGFYFAAIYNLLEASHPRALGLLAVALAAFHLGMARKCGAGRPGQENNLAALLLSGLTLAFVTVALGLLLFSFRITIAWALEAYAIAWIAGRAREPRLVYASLAVFALVAVRLAAIDAGMYAGPDAYTAIVNARFLAFLIAAAAFWLSARLIASGWQALAPYIGGHVAMLWGLILEVLGWAARHTSSLNYRNLASASVSILAAAYAVALVGFGVARRSALNRALGLGLIAIVVAKLYLYDVWRMSRGMYRFAAFAGLGVFLLTTSYLYSRYRGQIEALWRDARRQ